MESTTPNQLQKTAIVGTEHILRGVVMQKYTNLVMGSNIICTLYFNPYPANVENIVSL